MSDSSTSSRALRARPETLRGRALAASLSVAELAKSLAWCRDVVGFFVDREHERDARRIFRLRDPDGFSPKIASEAPAT